MSGRGNPYSQLLETFSSPAEISDSQWRVLGFHNLQRIKDGLDTLRGKDGLAPLVSQRWKAILRAMVTSCDPDQAFFGFQRWLEASNSHKDEPLPYELLDVLCALFAATPALSEYLIRFPDRTVAVLGPVLSREITGGAEWRRLLREKLRGAASHAAQLAILRQMRVESMLQIAALDLTGLSQTYDTVRALSDLADASLESALNVALQRAHQRFGLPEKIIEHSNLRFVVFALGKLGGRELNYSSDIDLVFAHDDRGEIPGAPRPLDAHTFYTAVSGEIVSALDKITEDGRVYRVDLRLRPHGSLGEIVQHTEDMLNYFQLEGRTWERQAWLKARPAAGNLALGAEFFNKLTPFIFRRYLSLDAIADLQSLKRQIELSVEKRGESRDEVKLGHGGIRDVEFTVQFMQLLHGSEHPRVRGGNTLNALYELRRERLLEEAEVEPLASAYIFLRNVEHRLQLHGDLQVHLLPQDAAAKRRIALSMGYVDSRATDAAGRATTPPMLAQEMFEAERIRHMRRTRETFQRLFAGLFRESSGVDGELSDLLLAPEPDLTRISTLLPHYGFANWESSAQELVELSQEKFILTAPSRTRKFFASIAPRLLRALASTGEPDEALRRFSRIAGSLGAKATFYQMLNENPWLLKMTADLAAWSEYLTEILIANPGLFDELVNALQTGQSKSAREMEQELAAIASGGDISDTLRAYRAGELLRVGVRDLLHDASLEQTQEELSDLAEAILRVQLQQKLKNQRERRGIVTSAAGKRVDFAVLGLGKFGSREMNYGSDLDVIYFYSEDGQSPDGLPAVSYFAEVAQDLTRAMATATLLGPLYELDARLRPNGTKGPLALSLGDFDRYWKDGQLADWERLALTRARFVAGDERTGERALHLVRSAVYSPLKDTETLVEEVLRMRRKLEEGAEHGDLKRGSGGIMDIEFTVQFLQLIHGPAFPPLRQANTRAALEALIKFKKLNAGDGKRLLEAYTFLRTMENRVRVVHGLSHHHLPSKAENLRRLAVRAGYTDETLPAQERLMDDYRRHTERTREIFERVVRKHGAAPQ